MKNIWVWFLLLMIAILSVPSFAMAACAGDDDDDDDNNDDNDTGDDDDDDDDDDNNDDDDTGDDDDDDDDLTPQEGEECIPAGAFQMGCEPEDENCTEYEEPRHEVMLSAYCMNIYPVTNQQYADYLNADNPGNDCDGEQCVFSTHDFSESGLYEAKGWAVDAGYEDRPVVRVTWQGAVAYCEAIGKRLPTEAEWEKAAKGAEEHYIYPWGDTWDPAAANWADGNDPYEIGGYPWTTPVGYFDGTDHGGVFQTSNGASPYGLYDMAGNVWEWCSDWWADTYYSEEPAGGWADPQGPDSGDAWVQRGGSWWTNNYAPEMRTTKRISSSLSSNSIGFRCARN